MVHAHVPARKVTVELPEEAFRTLSLDPSKVADELRVLWLIELVRERRLGHGKAAELAAMTRWDFILAMGRHGVSPFDYDAEELIEEFRPWPSSSPTPDP